MGRSAIWWCHDGHDNEAVFVGRTWLAVQEVPAVGDSGKDEDDEGGCEGPCDDDIGRHSGKNEKKVA